MTSHTHHLSFSEHVGLYLPHFLRPPMERDLRPSPPDSVPTTPLPSPVRARSYDPPDNATMVEPSIMTIHTRSNSAEHPGPSVGDDGKGKAEEGHAEKVREALEKSKAKRKMLSRDGYHVSLILTNSGSVARDHLASERTFLAYVRTSLALASTGVALVQLFTIASNTGTWQGSPEQLLVRQFATPLGSTMIILGFLVLLLGCLRYFAIQMALTRGVFPAARLTVVFIVMTLAVVTAVVFGVLLRGRQLL